jgi:hypothetical protein
MGTLLLVLTLSVTVETPITSLVGNRVQLREWCAAAGNYDACTRFVAYRVEGGCVREDDTWRIDAAATFRPYIFLWNLRSLSHEQEHIEDVRRDVIALVVGLESHRFAGEEACRSRLLSEQRDFGAKMRMFAESSNLARHASLRASLAR